MTETTAEGVGYMIVILGMVIGFGSGSIFGALYGILTAQVGLTLVLYSILHP